MINEISVHKITEKVSELCIKANKQLPCDIKERIKSAEESETSAIACSENMTFRFVRTPEWRLFFLK